jgi:hypothetical protein
MATVLLEQRFEPPLSEEDYAKLAKRLDPCLEIRDAVWVRSYVAADRSRCICEFEAPDAESVRQACRSADVPFERVWTASAVYKIEDYPALLENREVLRKRLGGGEGITR